MRYVLILLLGILLGAGVAIFFLGAPPAKSAPGQAVRAPDQGGESAGDCSYLSRTEFHRWRTGDNFLRIWERRRFNWGKTAAKASSELSRRCFREDAQTRSRFCLKAVA